MTSPLIQREEEMKQIKAVIASFMRRHDGLTSRQIQDIVYYADYRHYESKGERLTQADFAPSMYGMYSEMVKRALEQMEPDCKTTMTLNTHRQAVTAYIEPPVDIDVWELTDEWVAEICCDTQEYPWEALRSFSNETPLYEITDHGEPADFSLIDRHPDRYILTK